MKPPFLNSSLFSKSKTSSPPSPYSSAPTTPPSATLQSQSFQSQLAYKPDSLLTVSYPTIYIAICDHITDDPTLLSFKQGDSIKVMNKLPSGWWEGHLVVDTYPENFGIVPGQPMGLPIEFEAQNGFFPGKFVSKFDSGDSYGESTPSIKSPTSQLTGAPSIIAPKRNNNYEQSIISKRKNSSFSDTPIESEVASISDSIDQTYLAELKEALESGGGPKGLLENEWITDLYPKIKSEIIPEKLLQIGESIPKYWIKQSLPLPSHALSITSASSSTSSLSSDDSNETIDYYIQLITDEVSYTSPENWLGNLSNTSLTNKETEDKDSQILSRKNSISSIASVSSADSETIATYDPIAIPRQYRRPSAIGANLDSLEVQSDLSWVNLSTEVILSINKLQSTVDNSIQLDYLPNISEVVKSIQKLFEGTGITNFNSVIFCSQPELKDVYKRLVDLLGKVTLLLLNSINVWSLPDFKDRFAALIQQVLDLCRSFVSKCQMANIRCRLSNSVTSPIASSFGNVSLRRGSNDIEELNSCPGDLSNRLNQLILIITSDVTKIQKINPASFAPTHDESFIENSNPVSEQIINYITSLLNHSGEILTAVGGISVSNTNNSLSEKYDSILAGVYWKTAQLVIHLQSISPLLDFGKFLPIRKLCRDVHSELMKLVILSKLIINEQAIHDFLQIQNEIEMVKVSCFSPQELNSQSSQPSCPFQELFRLLNTVPSRSTIASLKRTSSKSSDNHRSSATFEKTLSGDFSSPSLKIPPKNPLRSRPSIENLGKLHHTRSSASLNRPSLPPIPASPEWKPSNSDESLSYDDIPLPPPPTIPLPSPTISKTSIDTDRSSKASSRVSSKRSSNISQGPRSIANYLKSPALLAVFNCDQHCTQHQFDLMNRTGAFIQQDPWFVKKDYRDADLVLDDESVLGATLPRLIEYLTPFQNPNPEFTENFLLTYRGFTTTFNLFELLFKRFTDEAPSEIHPHMRMDYVKNRLGPIRQRVMEVLWTWLDSHMQEDETEALQFLEEFANTIMMKVVPEQARNFITLLKRRLKSSKEDQKSYHYRPWGTKVKRFKLDVLEIQVIEFAYQLTMTESFHFGQIDPRELLNLEWEKPLNSKNFHIRAIMYVSNCISSWVARSITAAKETDRSTAYMEFFVQLASTLRMLNNFNGLMSVLMGFNSVPVEDLTSMWSLVHPDHKETIKRLARMMDPHLNFSIYRETLGQTNGPCIPFLGAYVSGLRFIEESHPNYLPDNSELINFEKQKKVSTIIKEVRRMQKDQSGFNYKGCKPYLDYLHTLMSKVGIINPLYPLVKDFDHKSAQAHLKIKSGSFAMDNFLSETGLLV